MLEMPDRGSGVNNALPATASPEEALQALVLDKDLKRLEDLLAEFNLFDVLRIRRRERQHSAVIAWLLDPRGSHGLRDHFLRRFLSEAAAEGRERGIADVTPLDVDGWELSNVEVEIERHYADIEHNYVDIMLIDATDGFVCLIENKIGSGEHSAQLSRYLETVEREHKGLNPFPIFLTPDGREPEGEDDAERYVPFGYRRVAELIERTIRTRGSIISASVAGFLEQYARTVRRHVLSNNDDISELALQIYSNHRAAIDLINNAVKSALPALEARAWDVIDAVLDQYAPLLQADTKSNGYHRFRAPGLEEIPELKNRILLFEFKYRDRNFFLNIRPGPEETRKRLYDVLQRDGVPGVAMRPSRRLEKDWHIVYSMSLFEKRDSLYPDYEEARPQIEKSISDFFENDYWPLVNAVRREFGLSPASASSASNATID